MRKHATNEQLSDKAFAEEVFLSYTENYEKRYVAEHHLIAKLRTCFKEGDPYGYGMDMMETVFQQSECCSREEMFRQWIYLERMETKMKTMDHKIDSLMTTVQKLTQEKAETQEAFYDCQAELLQQKEYVAILERDEAIREGKRLQHIQKIREYIEHTEDDLEGIERTLNSLRQSPYSVVESVNSLKERKGILLKQKQSYQELLGFIV